MLQLVQVLPPGRNPDLISQSPCHLLQQNTPGEKLINMLKPTISIASVKLLPFFTYCRPL